MTQNEEKPKQISNPIPDLLVKSMMLPQIPSFNIIPPNLFKSLALSQQELIAGITKAIAGVNAFHESVAKISQQLNDTITKLIPDIKRFTEVSNKMMEYKTEEKKLLLESGWFISPSMDKLRFTFLASAIHSPIKGRNSKVATLMKKIYGDHNWQYLGETIATWSKHRFFNAKRMKIIKDAYEAHQNKKYTLTIPSLLPIVEGICGDYCREQKNRIPRTIRPSSSYDKAAETLKLLNSDGEKQVAELVSELLLNQLYIRTSNLPTGTHSNKKYLNRHAILHGSQTGYPDCARSLRCFLLLDVLTLL